MRKRIVSFVLAAVMCISMIPTAFAASTSRFEDVADTAWYASAVDYAVEHGLFSGTGKTTFSPNDTMTRAMFVTVLARMNGLNDKDMTNSEKFTDVVFDSWYGPSVIWANENGYVNGTSSTTFTPGAAITREQIAAILYRYLGGLGLEMPVAENAPASFTDAANISAYAKDGVEAMRKWGFVNGSNGAYNPKRNITRAEAAAILMRVDSFLTEAAADKGSKVNAVNVTLNRTSLTMQAGDTFQLKATVTPGDATDKSLQWSTSGTNVVTVDNGKLTAVKAGTATITVKTANGKTATCKVTVTDKKQEVKAESVTVGEKEISMKVGETYTLKANILPQDTTNKTLIWTSADTTVVVVRGNTATATGVGMTTVSVRTENGKSDSCVIRVEENKASSFSVKTNNLDSPDEFVFSTSIYDEDDAETGSFYHGFVMITDSIRKDVAYSNWPGAPVYTFKSSDTSVVSIDENGRLTAARMQPGEGQKTAVITVTSKDTGESAQLKVTVKECVYYSMDDPEYFERFRDEMLRLVNEARENEGLNPLEYAYGAQPYADTRAKELSIKFGHGRPNGTESGAGAENIRQGSIQYGKVGSRMTSTTPEKLAQTQMNGWMNSSGHKKNILLPYTTYAIFGLHIEEPSVYATQNFFAYDSEEEFVDILLNAI